MRRRYRIAAAAAALLSWAVPETAAANTAPPVYPTPQQLIRGQGRISIPARVTIVEDATTDPAALAVVRRTLQLTGASVVLSSRRPPARELGVYLGGRAISKQGLARDAAAGLAPGGYVLSAGRAAGGRQAIVLDGVDPTGQFYAAQTFRQLLSGRTSIQRVVITDWPSFPVRGLVEGFYGPPWSFAQRQSLFDFLGAHKLNTYMYAPKDDPYHRARWRDPYPARQASQLSLLVKRATADHVTFTFTISPGLSICYSSSTDEQALIAKLSWAWSIGIRSFAIAFDDIDADRAPCDGDVARFGRGPSALGQAQADLLNRVQWNFVDTHSGAATLIAVPTEYSGTETSAYKQSFAAQLDHRVIVQWTGRYGISVAISATDAQAVRAVFPQPLLLWDNYYVNDYARGFLALGALERHDPSLPSLLRGLLADPQVQASSAKIGLFTVADYTWNPAAYNPTRSWTASLSEFAGGDPQARTALQAFADANYGSFLNEKQAPSLAAAISRFWGDWAGGDTGAASRLAEVLRRLGAAPATLRTQFALSNPGFLTEAAPWLDATQAWAETASTALDMLVAQRDGSKQRAAADRVAIPRLRAVAMAPSSLGTPVQVAPGVLDSFVSRALSGNP